MAERFLVDAEGWKTVAEGEVSSHRPNQLPVEILQADGAWAYFHATDGSPGVGYELHDNGTLGVRLNGGGSEPVRIYGQAGWHQVRGPRYEARPAKASAAG
jgi:hypothetical protein